MWLAGGQPKQLIMRCKMNNSLQHGDIFLARLEDRDLTCGDHLILILSSRSSINSNPNISFVPITSKSKPGFFNYLVESNFENGLDLTSYILTNQVRTISKKNLLKKIGFLSIKQIDEVLILINRNFGIEIIIQNSKGD